jgi:hypothetical protein
MSSYASQRARRLKLEEFIDTYGATISTALEVYAEYMRKEAGPLLARFEEIKDDPEARATQDASWVTTLGLRHMAGLFNENAGRADKAAAALRAIEESEGSDD